MKSYRVALEVAYLLCLYMLAGSVSSMWHRHVDPLWRDTLYEVRPGYDAIGIFNILLSLAVMAGLTLRHEWARIFAIVLAVLALFIKIGIPIAGAYFTEITLASMFRLAFTLESWGVTLLAVATIFLLTRPGVKNRYSAHRTPKQTSPDDIHGG